MKSIIIIFCLASATGLSVLSCGDAENHKRHFDAHKKQVVVDTDMGLDDMRAIMAILADTGVAVKGIIVNTGSADQGVGADNLIGMLESHHIETVPVLKGIDKYGHKIPAWRETANNLSGSKFPPPRELGSTPLPDNWLVNQSYTDILALGPLSNLAAHVDRLSGSCRIWIPASVTNQEVHEWNFTFDPEAAEKMFSKAGTVFLVDIPEIPQAQVYALLSGLGSASPTVRWISDVVTSADTFSYKQIFDEFVVAALLYPQFLANDGQRYRCRIGSDGAGRLEPADDGNVRLVSFKDHTHV